MYYMMYYFAMAAKDRLKQHKFISSQFWRLEVQDQGASRFYFY